MRTRDAYANLALPAILRRHRLRDRDAGLATELGYGTLRARGLLDAVIEACTDRPLDRVEPPLLDALRLGAYQLLRTRIPAHAAVDTTVELVRAEAGSRSAGFVNAILRKVGELDEPAWVAAAGPGGRRRPDRARRLRPRPPAVDRPGLRRRAGPGDGPGELDAALAADDARPAVHLLGRPGEITAAELALVTGGTEAPYSPYGVHLEPGGGDVGELDVIREGLAVVQDEGSQLVALAAARAPLTGRRRRPLAGPVRRARRQGGAAGRAGRAGRGDAWTRWRSASTGPTWCAGRSTGCRSPCTSPTAGTPRCPAGGYDRVLVDAPCSGLGALRRRPEARWRRSPDDVSGLTRLQRELLTAALRHVRPGGVVGLRDLLPAPGRDRGRAARACCAGTPGVERLDARELLPGVPDLGAGPTVQLWPHRHGTDAMFLALLRRPADRPGPGGAAPRNLRMCTR